MSFPSSIDSIPQPSSTSPTNNPGAAEVSTAQTNAIVAIETKLGTGASTPVASTLLRGTGTGTTAFAQANLTTDVTGTLPTANGGTGNTTGTATVNANLTGPITSSGNATSIASQTGTGTKFVVDTSPTLVTPNLGTPSAAVLTNATGLPTTALINPYKFSVYQSVSTTLTTGGTFYTITFGTKLYDTGSNFSTSTNLFTAPIAGFYQFYAAVTINNGSSAIYFNTRLYNTNTSTALVFTQGFTSASFSNTTSVLAPPPLQLNAGDTIAVQGECSGGFGTVNSQTDTYFGGFLVSAT